MKVFRHKIFICSLDDWSVELNGRRFYDYFPCHYKQFFNRVFVIVKPKTLENKVGQRKTWRKDLNRWETKGIFWKYTIWKNGKLHIYRRLTRKKEQILPAF